MPVFLSEEDAYTVHFSHNDTLVIAVYTGCCKVSTILINGRSSVNILYRHALYRIEDTPELACKMIIPQTQSLLYGLDESETCSSETIEFTVQADPYNIITEFCVLDVESPYNAILERLWIHVMRAIPSTQHQLLKYPTPSGMAN